MHLNSNGLCAGVAEWLRQSVSNIVRSNPVGLNPVIRITSQKPAVNSAVHPSDIGK